VVYLDNAATTREKPPQVLKAMSLYMRRVSASPGRSAHRLAVEAVRILFETREALAELLGVEDSSRIIFTPNATYAINLALYGVLKKGDHVVTSSMEHNSVMRPLRHLQKVQSVRITCVPANRAGESKPEQFKKALTPKTRLIVVNHASNVVGTLTLVEQIAEIAAGKKIPLLVDAAQTAGAYPLNLSRAGITLLAFTGHKALFGPQGIGGIYIAPEIDPEPLIRGGTGSNSEYEQQPEFLPDKFESGTLNAVGIAGLGAAVKFILRETVKKIRKQEIELTGALLERLRKIPRLTVYGTKDPLKQAPIVSVNLHKIPCSDVALILDREFNIAVRAGLQCAPAAHKTIGTFPDGTVRISLSYFNALSDVDAVAAALDEVSKR
jgi:cysteine desulfurase family protein